MLRTVVLLFPLLISLVLVDCSCNSTTKPDSTRKIEYTYYVPPSSTARTESQQVLDQQLFDVVGESVVTQTPDDPSAALFAINAGANVNARNKLGDTPLLIAARNGRVNVLKVLLDNGAEINARDDRGETALMRASSNVAVGDGPNDVKAVRLLIAGGADVNLKDNNGYTALSGSEMPRGNSDPNYRVVRRMLKKAGAR